MQLREKLTTFLDDIETPEGRIFNLTILVLIVLSSIIFVANTYSIPESVRFFIDKVDFFIIIIFSIEYFLRFWCAESKLKFFFSLFSIVDMLAIFPRLLGLTDIQFIRVFRYFLILRIISYFNLELSIFRITTEDGVIITRILLTLFVIIFVYSGLIYQVEHPTNPETFHTFGDAIYFSVVTMTTVGFGDITPISQTGRLMTLFMIMTGIALIPLQISNLIKQLIKTATKIEKSCLKCGWQFHDTDAMFCKICGAQLPESSND